MVDKIMSKKIIYDESLDSEIQFKNFVATQAPENHEISDEDVEQMEMANLIDLEIQDHEKFMNQVRDSYCEYDSYDDYLIEEQYMDKIEEPFDLEQEYDKWDDYSDCIDSDLEYKEYQQEQFRKKDSIEGPMSCFEHGYYMDESSNSNHEEPPFIGEYDFDEPKMELEYEKNSYLVENEVTPEDIMSERIEEHKKEEKEYMDMLTLQQEDFNPFEYYPDSDAGCNDISIDAQYFEYKQAELKKENSIEGPMSCFEHGYYMDGPSDSDYENLSFMEEYDFEDNLTFEMKEEIYGPDFESELQEDKEKEFKKN